MKTIVIHHSADFDGIFCRHIAIQTFGTGADYIGWDYGDPVPEIPVEASLYMLDVSIKELMDHPQLTWIDHHISAIEEFGSKPGLQIDGVAACRLAWHFWNSYSSTPTKAHFRDRIVVEPLAVRLAGEYDIGDKRDPRAELFQHGLRSCEPDMRRLLANDTAYVNQLLEQGKCLQYARERENASISKYQSFDLEFEGLKFIACNAARFNSLLFTAAFKPEHDACLGFCWHGGKGLWKVSMYGAPGKPDIDLSAIAKKYGGGGHKQACGFECKTLPFDLPKVAVEGRKIEKFKLLEELNHGMTYGWSCKAFDGGTASFILEEGMDASTVARSLRLMADEIESGAMNGEGYINSALRDAWWDGVKARSAARKE